MKLPSGVRYWTVPVVATIDDLLALGIDYAVVAIPTQFHVDAGLQLAAAGVHALVEKPLTTDAASSRRIANAFAGAGLIGAVGHLERYNRRCSRPAPASPMEISARSTKSPLVDKARFPDVSPTSA